MLRFLYQPLSSYWWNVRIALGEWQIPHIATPVDLADAEAVARFRELSPLGTFPVMEDVATGFAMYEANQMLDYIQHRWSPDAPLLSDDPELDREIRFRDRFFEAYLHVPLIRLVSAGPLGDGAAGAVRASMTLALAAAYDVLERDLQGREWAAGASFSLADCCALPLLTFASAHQPIGESRPVLDGYLTRLRARPSVRALFEQVRPVLRHYPGTEEERSRLIEAAS